MVAVRYARPGAGVVLTDRITIIAQLAIDQHAERAKAELEALAIFYRRSLGQRARWHIREHCNEHQRTRRGA